MSNYYAEILKILKDKKHHTAAEISNNLKLSDRTIRKHIKDLNFFLEKQNCKILSFPRYGYLLQCNDKDLENLNEDFLKQSKIPTSKNEREDYLISLLINNDNYLKLEKIANSIFVSQKTLSLDLKDIKVKLKEYNLNLKVKPHYGIKIDGSEIDIRNFIIDNTKINLIKNNDTNEQIIKLGHLVYDFFYKNKLNISDISLQNLVIAIFVTLNRIKRKKYISSINFEKNNIFMERREKVITLLKNLSIINLFNENEIDYIVIHFLSNETLTLNGLNSNKIKEINNLIKDIYKYVYFTFNIDFEDDKILYNNLYSHLLALSIRVKFGIKIQNPILDDIKRNMSLEFNVAKYISKIIAKKYLVSNISEEETAYIALILHISGKFSIFDDKKNILIVCPTGRGISKFLTYTFNNLFSIYLKEIGSCGINELKKRNLDNVDIIFTLVDLDFHIPKPVYKINYFLNNNEIEMIKSILNEKSFDLTKIILRELFTVFENGETKEQIIKTMSNKLKIINGIPENIEQQILKRETLGLTEICNKVAIPHAIDKIEQINIVGVAILKKPIIWEKNEVSLVIFLCIDDMNNKIYETISKLINKDELIDKLTNCTKYDDFIKVLSEIR